MNPFKAMGLELFAKTPSNALTAVKVPEGIDGGAITKKMRDEQGITIAGGQASLKGKIFRLGHLGYMDAYDTIATIVALEVVLTQLGHEVELGKRSSQSSGNIDTGGWSGMPIKVLISDPLSKEGVAVLKKNKIKYDEAFKLTESQLAKKIKGYDGLIIRSGTTVTKKIIKASDKLKVIGRAGVGLDNVDVDAASKKGIVVMKRSFRKHQVYCRACL